MLQVVVGNLRYELGVLRYDTASDNTYLIIGSAVGGGVLIFIIIVILIVYKRSSSEAERQYKKIQLQLVTLESNVRNECKLGKKCLKICCLILKYDECVVSLWFEMYAVLYSSIRRVAN